MRHLLLSAIVFLLPGLGLGQETVRIQNRLLEKNGRFFLTAGATFLDRDDYFSNPGALLSAAWYFRESDGLELRATWFFSRLTPAGQEVVDVTGLRPDAHQPRALLLGGWRHSIGYGKVLVGSTVVHFDLQGAAHAGTIVTDRAVTPAAALSPGLVIRVGPRLHAQFDVPAVLSFEPRTRGQFAFGLAPSVSLGTSL